MSKTVADETPPRVYRLHVKERSKKEWDYATKVQPSPYVPPPKPIINLKNVKQSQIPYILKCLTPDNEVDEFFHRKNPDPYIHQIFEDEVIEFQREKSQFPKGNFLPPLNSKTCQNSQVCGFPNSKGDIFSNQRPMGPNSCGQSSQQQFVPMNHKSASPKTLGWGYVNTCPYDGHQQFGSNGQMNKEYCLRPSNVTPMKPEDFAPSRTKPFNYTPVHENEQNVRRTNADTSLNINAFDDCNNNNDYNRQVTEDFSCNHDYLNIFNYESPQDYNQERRLLRSRSASALLDSASVIQETSIDEKVKLGEYFLQLCLQKPAIARPHLETIPDNFPAQPRPISQDSSNASLRVLISREDPIKSIPSCNCSDCYKCQEYLQGARATQSLSCLDQTNYVQKNILDTKKFTKPVSKKPKKVVDSSKGDRIAPIKRYAQKKGYGQIPDYLKKRKEEVLANIEVQLEQKLHRTLMCINAVEARRTRGRRFLINQLAEETRDTIRQIEYLNVNNSTRPQFSSKSILKKSTPSDRSGMYIGSYHPSQYEGTCIARGRGSSNRDDIYIGSLHSSGDEEEAEDEEKEKSVQTEEVHGHKYQKKDDNKVVENSLTSKSKLTQRESAQNRNQKVQTATKRDPKVLASAPEASDSEPSSTAISVPDVQITPSMPNAKRS